MMKLLNQILQTIELLRLYIKVKTDERIIKREVEASIDVNLDVARILQEDNTIQQKYQSGILNLKRNIRKASKVVNKDTLDKALRQSGNVVDLAKVETEEQKKVRLIKESMYIYKGSDIKTEQDKVDMIDKRIDMYKELQNKQVERQLLRQIRQAKNNNDLELHKKLTEELSNKYGRNRKN